MCMIRLFFLLKSDNTGTCTEMSPFKTLRYYSTKTFKMGLLALEKNWCFKLVHQSFLKDTKA